jgi:glutamate racemase
MPDYRPVGVFDSGVGGLSVVREMRLLMPSLDILYVSDARFLPYGERSEAFIRARALAITDFLTTGGAAALVVACNTATAAAALELRARYRLPIIGIEPAVKPASGATASGTVAILATASTLQSRKYADLLERFGGFVRVIGQPCRGLVECVEAGELDGPRTHELLRGYVEPLLEAGADTLVLGCTHYPFLADALHRIVAGRARIVDPGAAVARRVAQLLEAGQLAGHGELRCFTSGDTAAQRRVMSLLLDEAVDVSALPEKYCVTKTALSGT